MDGTIKYRHEPTANRFVFYDVVTNHYYVVRDLKKGAEKVPTMTADEYAAKAAEIALEALQYQTLAQLAAAREGGPNANRHD